MPSVSFPGVYGAVDIICGPVFILDKGVITIKKGVNIAKMLQNKRRRHQQCAKAYSKAADEQGDMLERIARRCYCGCKGQVSTGTR